MHSLTCGTARVQVVDEKMLVFINDLLSSGEIPDLFPAEDKDEIINAMRSETKANGLVDTNDNCWATFINKVKANLHMVFTASPVGDNFRIRSQRFLATINSTVIDWFQPWPETSLLSVAERFLKDVDLGNDTVRTHVRQLIALHCCHFTVAASLLPPHRCPHSLRARL